MGSQRRIKITAGDVQVAAVLGPGATADLVWEALPIEASASTWGDEIYFRTRPFRRVRGSWSSGRRALGPPLPKLSLGGDGFS